MHSFAVLSCPKNQRVRGTFGVELQEKIGGVWTDIVGSEYCVVCPGITSLGLTKISLSLCAPTMPPDFTIYLLECLRILINFLIYCMPTNTFYTF